MQLDHRPRVEHDAVPHEATVQRPAGLEGTDRLEHRHQDAFELRQGNEPPAFVVDGGEVSDLGEREQPLILGVGAGDPSEHVDVLV